MKWLDPKTHPIPQDWDELFIAYVYDEEVQKRYVVIAKKDESHENRIVPLKKGNDLDYWLDYLNEVTLLAWMFLPLPPESHDKYLEEKQKELEDTILQSIKYDAYPYPSQDNS